MTNALAPLYLSSLVPQTVSNASRYNLRNSNDLQTVEARYSLFYNSFLSSAVRAWNSLLSTAKQSDSTNSFKYFLNKDKDSTPKYYYAGNRQAQIFHARLRTDCSSLKLDLFLKNVRLSLMSLWQCRGCTTFLFSLWKLPASSNCTSGCCFPLPES